MKKKLLALCLPLIILAISCGKEREDNRYTLIGQHWVESARTINGKNSDPTQLQHIFFSNGYQGRLDYEYICGITGDECLPGQHFYGSWQLLSDTSLSTQLNGAIRVYAIERLTPTELWLKFDRGNDEIISKLIRYR
ncbi:hypothetical protein EDD80_102380 [Anseongella ginsenosidimutans]|uniref:Lipocalin-like protein n=1 Tax=Anseongella ginsenosidimutans TaxID=496056 RepID=A0A4R3KWS3_9SPHI|nr:hypothetical protein [Anseongella ginsenosidimutans]QEC51815.1 hypothetical protein FRZ59_05320 [Anseongella ginsenosidimutans]TCS89186.1 hypothetical protein EDD80_102380 [Anseongella ginsenosidimutans]